MLPVAYCFSSSHAQRTNEFDGIVRTWITQAAQNSTDVFRVCQRIHQKQSARRAPRNAVWTLLREISLQCISVVFLIDGLDEFPTINDARSRFLRDIKNAVASTGVKVIVTSRSEVDIGSEVSASATHPTKHLMLDCIVTKEDVKSDVHLYSQYQVAQKFPRHGKNFRQEIATHMAENAGGMFLLIKLQQSQLRSSQNMKTIQSIVQKMPQGLHQTYARDWNGIQASPVHDRERAILILRWLTFGYRALTVEEMSEALVIDFDNDKAFRVDDLPKEINAEYINNEIKGLCGSLVEIQREGRDADSPSETVHLVHASVREYLITVLPVLAPFASIRDASLQHASQHTILAAYCLKFLNSHAAWERTEEGGSRSFLSYAVCLLVEHLSDIGGSHHDLLAKMVLEFMETGNANFAKWQKEYEVTTWGEWIDLGAENNPSKMYYACLFSLPTIMDHFHTYSDEDINSVGGQFGTPLQVACALGCEPAFDRLLHWGADIAVRAGQFNTAINAAALRGSYRMANALLAQYIQQDLLRVHIQEAIVTAAEEGHKDIVKLFLEHTLLVDNQHEHDLGLSKALSNSLLVAAEEGHAAIVEMLLEHEADIAARNDIGDTALHVAAVFNHVGVAKVLLHKGASIGQDGSLGSPLHSAARYGNLEIVIELSERGASIVSHGKGGDTPLHLAAFHGFADIVAFLLSHGADIDARNEWGLTALIIALVEHHQQTLDILFEHRADVNIADTKDWRSIHYAALYGLVDTILILIEKGADLNARTNSGATPLHIGVLHRQKAVAQLLLRLGAAMTFSPSFSKQAQT